MLEEWIRNIPLSLVETIASDAKVRGTPIWSLANRELRRRHMAMGNAA